MFCFLFLFWVQLIIFSSDLFCPELLFLSIKKAFFLSWKVFPFRGVTYLSVSRLFYDKNVSAIPNLSLFNWFQFLRPIFHQLESPWAKTRLLILMSRFKDLNWFGKTISPIRLRKTNVCTYVSSDRKLVKKISTLAKKKEKTECQREK